MTWLINSLSTVDNYGIQCALDETKRDIQMYGKQWERSPDLKTWDHPRDFKNKGENLGFLENEDFPQCLAEWIDD